MATKDNGKAKGEAKVAVALPDFKHGETVYRDLIALATEAGISMVRANKALAGELCLPRSHGHRMYPVTVAQPLLATAAAEAKKVGTGIARNGTQQVLLFVPRDQVETVIKANAQYNAINKTARDTQRWNEGKARRLAREAAAAGKTA